MNIFRKKLLLVLAMGILLASCQAQPVKPVKKAQKLFITEKQSKPLKAMPIVEFKVCKEPRPQMCTKEYLAVCAKRDTGIRCVTTPCPSSKLVIKPNACVACSDEKVLGYTVGACN